MKLAEALNLRADLQRRIEQLRKRLINNAKVQEGDNPSEKPEELLAELESCCGQLNDLILRINITNARSENSDGKTITEIISYKDTLMLKLGVYRDFLDNASKKLDRYTQREIKIVSTVNVREMQKQVDEMAKQLRETDSLLQQMNWNTDLMEI
ncbi:MAG: DIP1984 family protein [Ruminococcus sp.]|nr:DIP1984 family protein [Ruminococcus sp.]